MLVRSNLFYFLSKRIMTTNLLHVTDTHLWCEKDKPLGSGVLPYYSLKAVLETAAADFQKNGIAPHVIFVSGDFTHDDKPESYAHVAALINEFAAKFLSSSPKICFCEGNHGDVQAAANVFEKASKWVGAAAAGSATLVDVDSRWQMGIVSSHVPGEIFGNVAEADMEFLSKKFLHSSAADAGSSSKAEKKHKIIALHHPPVHPGLEQGPADGNSWAENCLKDPSRRKMRDLIYGPGNDDLKMVLHGHLHIDLMVPAPPQKEANENPEAPWAYMPKQRGQGNPMQVCGPATCQQHHLMSWEKKPENHLNHGCALIQLHDDGTWNRRTIWAEKSYVA